VDIVASEAKVGGCSRFGVSFSNAKILCPVACSYIAPLLRFIVFLGKPHFSAGADRKRMCLCPSPFV